jgi:hypothetical protein
MAKIKLYNRDDGSIFNEQDGHPHNLDPLTTARQREMMEIGWDDQYYDIGMIVSEGDNAVFMPDYVTVDASGNKFIKAEHLATVNGWQHQPS